MSKTAIGKRTAARSDYWRERIAGQEGSGLSVRQFCRKQGLNEHSYYTWRKRLRQQQQPVRFALVERGPAGPELGTEESLEVVLVSGERLRITAGVEAATLRMVLGVLRA